MNGTLSIKSQRNVTIRFLAPAAALLLAICMFSGCGSAPEQNTKADGFVSIAEAAPGVIMEIRYYSYLQLCRRQDRRI